MIINRHLLQVAVLFLFSLWVETAALDVIFDMSKEDKSVSDVITPVSRW